MVENDVGSTSELLTVKGCAELNVEDIGADASDSCRRHDMFELLSVAAARLPELAGEDQPEDCLTRGDDFTKITTTTTKISFCGETQDESSLVYCILD